MESYQRQRGRAGDRRDHRRRSPRSSPPTSSIIESVPFAAIPPAAVTPAPAATEAAEAQPSIQSRHSASRLQRQKRPLCDFGALPTRDHRSRSSPFGHFLIAHAVHQALRAACPGRPRTATTNRRHRDPATAFDADGTIATRRRPQKRKRPKAAAAAIRPGPPAFRGPPPRRGTRPRWSWLQRPGGPPQFGAPPPAGGFPTPPRLRATTRHRQLSGQFPKVSSPATTGPGTPADGKHLTQPVEGARFASLETW